ncbi:hypothetical protein [Methylopila sp. M107]|uniref:FitA-like ribbon-helix-helix domain-containing protein n=1 Tax=Methylopila sp. M107 TaxID=1101190 RepID=UPI000362F7C0|nr:hypothetical protein [Methylopila sp. M107]
MASLTVRRIDERVKAKLKERAARNGRPLEAELRSVLTALAEAEPADRRNMAERIRARVEPLGGAELEPFPRISIPAPRAFEE